MANSRGSNHKMSGDGRRRKISKPARARSKSIHHRDVAARAGKRSAGAVFSFSKNLPSGKRSANRKSIEEQLAFQVDLLANTHDAIVARDENGIITYWNRSAEKLLGWTAREVLGKPSGNIFNFRISGISHTAAREKMLKNNVFEGEAWFTKKDGASILIEVRLSVLRGPDGEFKGTVSNVRDITGRRIMEEALRESEANLAESQRLTKTGSWSYEIATWKARWSDEIYRIFDIEKTAAGGQFKSILKRVHPEDRERVEKNARKAMSNGNTFTIEYRILTSRGEKTVREVAFASKDASGNVTRIFGTVQDITDQRRIQEEERRLRALMDNNPSVIFMKDETGRYVYLNDAYEKQFVFSKDWRGKTDFDFWPKESAELFRANDAEVLKSGRTHQFLEDSFDLQGKRHCWLNYKFPFTDANGRKYLGGIGIEAVDRIQAEEALRKSESELAESQRVTKTGSWSRDIATGKIHWSDELYRIFELEKTEFGGQYPSFLDRVHPEDRELVKKAGQIEGISETPFNFEYRIATSSGVKIVRETVFVTKDAGGRIVQLFGTAQDVTDIRKAEEALQESEEKFRTLSESSPVAILVYRGNRLLYANSAAARIFEYTNEKLLAMDHIDLIHADHKNGVQERVRKRMAGDKDPAQYEIKAVTGTGREKWLDISSNLIAYKGERAGIVICMDITEKKHAEEVLRQDNETLERLVQEHTRELMKTHAALERSKRMADIGRLSVTVAHELRNPLAAIKTALYNIQRKSKDARLAHHLIHIDKKVLESNQIILNLLSFSRIKSIAIEKLDICALLKDCIAAISQKYAGGNVTVKELINCGKEDSIEGDDTQLRMLVNNILDNAYQALHNNTGTITVAFGKTNDEAWELSVADTGVGIDEQDIGKIFDPFFTSKAKGTGLGLTVCKEIAEMHGGRIEVQSTKGAGTTFTVTLPIARKAVPHSFQPSARP